MKLLKISERSKTKYFERSTLSSESESVSRSVVSNSLRPMYYSLPGSSGHRILQARILPFPSPGDLPHPGIKSRVPCIAGRFFTVSASSSRVFKGISKRISIQNRTRKFDCCQCPSAPISLLPKTCVSSPSIYSASVLF